MSNALAVINSEQFEVTQRVAKAMVASGYFADSKDVAQAVVKIMAGQEMGLQPFASMTGIHIIKGRPALGANLIATLIKNDPRYDYRVTEMTDKQVSITFYENGQQVGVSAFSAQDAQRAGTQNMGKFPRNMLFARAMSNGAKWYTPGVFGGSPVYTPDELGMTVDEDGDIYEGEIVTESEPVVEDDEQPEAVDVIAELRASLEGMRLPTLGSVAAAAFDSGHYNHMKHVMNALCKHELIASKVADGSMECAEGQRVSNAGAVQLFDWLIERKQETEEDAPLFADESAGAFEEGE